MHVMPNFIAAVATRNGRAIKHGFTIDKNVNVVTNPSNSMNLQFKDSTTTTARNARKSGKPN